MKAAVFREVGVPLRVEDIEPAPPGPGMVEVRLSATGVCHTDLSLLNGTIPQQVPAVLGHEGAGVIIVAVASSSKATCCSARISLRGRPSS